MLHEMVSISSESIGLVDLNVVEAGLKLIVESGQFSLKGITYFLTQDEEYTIVSDPDDVYGLAAYLVKVKADNEVRVLFDKFHDAFDEYKFDEESPYEKLFLLLTGRIKGEVVTSEDFILHVCKLRKEATDV